MLLTVCLPLDAIFHVDRKTQMSQGNNFVIKKEILLCVIAVTLHIVNITVMVDCIPAVMLL